MYNQPIELIDIDTTNLIAKLLVDITIKTNCPIYLLLTNQKILNCKSDNELLIVLEEMVQDLIFEDFLVNKRDVENEMYIRGN